MTDLATEKLAKLQRKKERQEKRRISSVANAKEMRKLRNKSIISSPVTTIPEINVGCSGWFYWHWSNKFYNNIEPKNWFNHYLKHFDTVELNAPFYSWPTINTVKTWIRQAKSKEKFIYTVKVSELITHIKRFSGTQALIKDFYYIATILSSRMGCFLFQLPPSFHYTPARLKNILSQLDNKYRNVVEFRHASWWNNDVYKAMRKHKIIFCSCSSPKLPQELIATAPDIYIRFHGIAKMYRHDYSKQELEEWANKIRASKAKRVWIYFNNDNEGYAIKNAQAFIKLLKSF